MAHSPSAELLQFFIPIGNYVLILENLLPLFLDRYQYPMSYEIMKKFFEFWRPFYLDHIKTNHIHKFDLVITYKHIIHFHKENLFSLQIERNKMLHHGDYRRNFFKLTSFHMIPTHFVIFMHSILFFLSK